MIKWYSVKVIPARLGLLIFSDITDSERFCLGKVREITLRNEDTNLEYQQLAPRVYGEQCQCNNHLEDAEWNEYTHYAYLDELYKPGKEIKNIPSGCFMCGSKYFEVDE